MTAPVWRRSWKRRSERPAISAAFLKYPVIVEGHCWRPLAAGKRRPSWPGAAWVSRCSLMIGIRCGGMATSRMPAYDLGGSTWILRFTQTTPRRTWITPVQRPLTWRSLMSLRRSSAISP